MGHVPYAGRILHKWTGNHVASEFFERYVRMKKIVWPDEAARFLELFTYKHPEIPVRSFLNRYAFAEYWGAYWHGSGYQDVRRLFAGTFYGSDEGILYGDPITPKPKDRNKVFFKRSTELFIIKSKMGMK